MFSKFIALAAVVMAALSVATTAPAATPAQRDTAARAALSDLAAHVTHGWADLGLSYPQMEDRLAQGGRLRIACGYVSILAVRRLLRLGVPARLVGAVTLNAVLPNHDGGHTLMEAYLDHRWQVFDVDFHVQPIESHGSGLTIERLVKLVQLRRTVRFKRLAPATPADWTDFPANADVASAHQEIEHGPLAFYRGFLQLGAVYTTQGWVYTAPPAIVSTLAAHLPGLPYNWLPAGQYAAATAPASAFVPSVLSW